MKTASAPSRVVVHIPLTFTVRGGRKTIVGAVHRLAVRTRFDDALAKALARALRWKTRLEDGTYATVNELAAAENINVSYVARILKLSLLAPDIVEAIVDGRSDLTVETLARPIPSDWREQRQMLGVGGPDRHVIAPRRDRTARPRHPRDGSATG